MTRALQEALFAIAPVRWSIALFMLCRGALRLKSGSVYRGLLDVCWVVRVSRARGVARLARPMIFAQVERLKGGAGNAVVTSFQADGAAAAVAGVYSLAGGTHELFRDLIVLKSARHDEKGVILLKYARTFDAVVSLFDLPRLMERYIFVLEPCWAGYCHPSTLMYVSAGNPVFVQCFTDEDYEFVQAVGAPLVALRLGPADWVNADLFRPKQPPPAKIYDLVMVANWSPQKRHALLFKALAQITERDVRVLLIGFPWADRTAGDVQREASRIGNPRIHIDILEQVPQTELAEHVARCKAFVFLNRKEGDNKALVEAMFADVPAIVYEKTIGGARSRINPSTGVLTSDEALADSIRHMIEHHHEFAARDWALAHTGSQVATRVLDDAIARTVVASGGSYLAGITEKVNSPNLAYRDPNARLSFSADYEFVLSCRRDTPSHSGGAVA